MNTGNKTGKSCSFFQLTDFSNFETKKFVAIFRPFKVVRQVLNKHLKSCIFLGLILEVLLLKFL